MTVHEGECVLYTGDFQKEMRLEWWFTTLYIKVSYSDSNQNLVSDVLAHMLNKIAYFHLQSIFNMSQ